jgi:uncharacterized Zn-binding protein involved in type VI secretion
MHMCPMVTPGVPPIPHVGGPIVGPGCPTVLICNMPAATMGDMCTCVGPPDSIILGSMGVFIGGKMAARMTDMCAHGGMITMGAPTVIIGEISPGTGGPVSPVVMGMVAPVLASVWEDMIEGATDTVRPIVALTVSLVKAAITGAPFVHDSNTCAVCAGQS